MLFTTNLSEAELRLLLAHQKTMGASSPGDVVRAALAAFVPPVAVVIETATTVAPVAVAPETDAEQAAVVTAQLGREHQEAERVTASIAAVKAEREKDQHPG